VGKKALLVISDWHMKLKESIKWLFHDQGKTFIEPSVASAKIKRILPGHYFTCSTEKMLQK
jgi:hypothetical protein